MEQKRCSSCMKLKTEKICEHCGYDEDTPGALHHLPAGAVLQERYLIGRVLGQGGFGITYLGWDREQDIPVAVKEYFPNGYVQRNHERTKEVAFTKETQEEFHNGTEYFLQEAKILAKLSDVPEVVHIHNYFQENGTAYIVMEYVRGMTLSQYIRKKGTPLSFAQTMKILQPIMAAMAQVHDAQLIHRDMGPDNIMLHQDGAKLLDFGAARDTGGADASKALPKSTLALVKHGYAALEQYHSRGSLGPWTDVYGMCATVYFCLTGRPPVAAPDRLNSDSLDWKAVAPELTAQQLETLNRAMALRPKDRLKDMRALLEGLLPGCGNGGVARSGAEGGKKNTPEPVATGQRADRYPRTAALPQNGSRYPETVVLTQSAGQYPETVVLTQNSGKYPETVPLTQNSKYPETVPLTRSSEYPETVPLTQSSKYPETVPLTQSSKYPETVPLTKSTGKYPETVAASQGKGKYPQTVPASSAKNKYPETVAAFQNNAQYPKTVPARSGADAIPATAYAGTKSKYAGAENQKKNQQNSAAGKPGSKNKKKSASGIIFALILVLLAAAGGALLAYRNSHAHVWTAPTCTEGSRCEICGKAGEAAATGHAYTQQTCEEPSVCQNCGLQHGEAPGHRWTEATCTSAKTCSVCGTTEGGIPGHDWVEATDGAPMTCSRCGETWTEAAESAETITGTWKPFYSAGYSAYCFVLDDPIVGCKSYTMNLRITNVTHGKVEGRWEAFYRDGYDRWVSLGYFELEEDQISLTYEFDKPTDITAVTAVVQGRSGNFSKDITVTDVVLY